MTKIQQAKISEKSDRDHVRLRKGMYIPNINYSVFEIIDNSIDEYMAGYASTIYLGIKDGVIFVQDDGRGIPIYQSEKDPSKSMAEIAYTSLKAGGKFGDTEGYENVKTGGLNGVGASAINFLSEYCSLRITIDGIQYGIDFKQGITTEDGLYEIGPVDEEDVQHGTLVELKPDPEIWGEEKLDLKAIVNRIEQLAFLNPGLTIIVDIDSDGFEFENTFCYPEGTKAYVEKLSAGKDLLTNVYQFEASDDKTNVDISIALAYSEGYNETIHVFTNNIYNELGGDHLTGFRMGLFKAIGDYHDEHSNNKGKITLTSEDCREGIIAIINVKMLNPNFEGQGKAKLNEIKVRTAVRKATEEYMADLLDKNPDIARILIAKATDSARAREAARRAKETVRKTKSVDAGKAEKLADCRSKNPEECEIFLVEGDSAAGTAKEGRDRNTQAILPVFGKILNVERLKLDKILSSDKIKDILRSLKCGIGEEFNLEKLRYHKIIIMADADVDGSHIQCLYIPLFYRFLKPIIDAGHLYFACPPLFAIKKGKQVVYAYNDYERDQILEELGDGCEVSRFKGLGEMNSEQLWETTMNPETRRLIQVVVDDVVSDEEMISVCMGEEVAPRRDFIMTNATSVELLD